MSYCQGCADREAKLAEWENDSAPGMYRKRAEAAEAKLREAHAAKTNAEESELATARELDEATAKLREVEALRDTLRTPTIRPMQLGGVTLVAPEICAAFARHLDAILRPSTTTAHCTCSRYGPDGRDPQCAVECHRTGACSDTCPHATTTASEDTK